MPAPLAVAGSRVMDASQLRQFSSPPSGEVLAGYLGGYRRDWSASGQGVAFVELFAFDSDQAALAWQSQLASAGTGPAAVDEAVPGATVSLIHGPDGDGYAILAERSRVVMVVTIGGPGVTQATADGLARTQYDRLCRS